MHANFHAYPQGPIQLVSGTPLAAAIHQQFCQAPSSLFQLCELAFHPDISSKM